MKILVRNCLNRPIDPMTYWINDLSVLMDLRSISTESVIYVDWLNIQDVQHSNNSLLDRKTLHTIASL
jgi:hypothetical protein